MAWRTRMSLDALVLEDAIQGGRPLRPNDPNPPDWSPWLPNAAAGQPLMPAPAALQPLMGTPSVGKFPFGTPARDHRVGSFVLDLPTPSSVLEGVYHGETFYLPPWTPPGAIGSFVIGESPIGYFAVPTHHTLLVTPSAGPGQPDVETEVAP